MLPIIALLLGFVIPPATTPKLPVITLYTHVALDNTLIVVTAITGPPKLVAMSSWFGEFGYTSAVVMITPDFSGTSFPRQAGGDAAYQ